MVSKFANPDCRRELRYLRDGRIYAFAMSAGNGSKSLEHFCSAVSFQEDDANLSEPVRSEDCGSEGSYANHSTGERASRLDKRDQLSLIDAT